MCLWRKLVYICGHSIATLEPEHKCQQAIDVGLCRIPRKNEMPEWPKNKLCTDCADEERGWTRRGDSRGMDWYWPPDRKGFEIQKTPKTDPEPDIKAATVEYVEPEAVHTRF